MESNEVKVEITLPETPAEPIQEAVLIPSSEHSPDLALLVGALSQKTETQAETLTKIVAAMGLLTNQVAAHSEAIAQTMTRLDAVETLTRAQESDATDGAEIQVEVPAAPQPIQEEKRERGMLVKAFLGK